MISSRPSAAAAGGTATNASAAVSVLKSVFIDMVNLQTMESRGISGAVRLRGEVGPEGTERGSLFREDVDLAVEHAPRAVPVDVLLPRGDHHRGDAVADQVAERPCDAHEPVHREQQLEADGRDGRDRG